MSEYIQNENLTFKHVPVLTIVIIMEMKANRNCVPKPSDKNRTYYASLHFFPYFPWLMVINSRRTITFLHIDSRNGTRERESGWP